MDVQRKKGILEVCVLAVLKKGSSYGYVIIRELERCIEISESTLYPILKRLEQNGSLKTYRKEYNGRMRKYYQLTEEGQYKIDQFLNEWDELQNMYSFVQEQNAFEPEVPENEEEKGEAEASETGNVTEPVQKEGEGASEPAETIQEEDHYSDLLMGTYESGLVSTDEIIMESAENGPKAQTSEEKSDEEGAEL